MLGVLRVGGIGGIEVELFVGVFGPGLGVLGGLDGRWRGWGLGGGVGVLEEGRDVTDAFADVSSDMLGPLDTESEDLGEEAASINRYLTIGR